MRTFKHWTPRYIVDRMNLYVHEKLNPETPWLSPSMVNILDTWIKPSDRGLEWGSGRSTIWFARRVSHLISIEHDKKWATHVQTLLNCRGLASRVSYYFFKDGCGDNPDSEYVKIIDSIEDESLDFCLIDGNLREHCALASLSKMKAGGIIIVDDVERYIPRESKTRSPNARGILSGYASKEWELFGGEVSRWRFIWTTNGISDTALWVKP